MIRRSIPCGGPPPASGCGPVPPSGACRGPPHDGAWRGTTHPLLRDEQWRRVLARPSSSPASGCRWRVGLTIPSVNCGPTFSRSLVSLRSTPCPLALRSPRHLHALAGPGPCAKTATGGAAQDFKAARGVTGAGGPPAASRPGRTTRPAPSGPRRILADPVPRREEQVSHTDAFVPTGRCQMGVAPGRPPRAASESVSESDPGSLTPKQGAESHAQVARYNFTRAPTTNVRGGEGFSPVEIAVPFEDWNSLYCLFVRFWTVKNSSWFGRTYRTVAFATP